VVIRGDEAPTDQAVRAARCAEAISAATARDAVALATGRVVLGARLLLGPVIDRAVQLLAPGGGDVRVDAATAALLQGRFRVSGDGEVRVLVGSLDASAPARRLFGKPTPCLGRERETAILEAAVATSVEESVASAILVTGPPGVGKSRLVAELARSARANARI